MCVHTRSDVISCHSDVSAVKLTSRRSREARMWKGRYALRHLRRMCDMKNVLVINFLFLSVNLFIVVMQLNQGLWPVATFFQPVLTREDRTRLLTTLEVFVTALEAMNLTYLLYAGSLIGAYRHHGPIPWDDDVDVMLNASQKEGVRAALRELEPEYGLYTYSDDLSVPTQWKFFKNSPRDLASELITRQGMFRYEWPYVDVFFFRENETHIWDEHPRFSASYRWPKSQVFPLEKRPFANLNLYAPCEPADVLATNYKIHLCRSRQFSHYMDFPLFSFNTKDVPCKRLHDGFPFVHRTFINGVVNETLQLGDWTLQSRLLPTHCKGQGHQQPSRGEGVKAV